MAKTKSLNDQLSEVHKKKETFEHGWNSEPETSQFIGALMKLTGAKIVVELGAFQGQTSLEIVKNLPKDGKAYLVDIEDHRCDELKELCDGERVIFMKESSFTAIPKISDKPDLVFIDSVHEFNHLLKEVTLLEKLGSRSMTLAFHDSVHMAPVRDYLKWLSKWYNITTLPTVQGRGLSIARLK